MKSHIFALVDIDNFYVSCERLFNQAIEHKPVVVLGNNDGCVIARSNDYVEYSSSVEVDSSTEIDY